MDPQGTAVYCGTYCSLWFGSAVVVNSLTVFAITGFLAQGYRSHLKQVSYLFLSVALCDGHHPIYIYQQVIS